jgi:hypothetical protein
MPTLKGELDLERCPFCNVDTPSLRNQSQLDTVDYANLNHRFWRFYRCMRCGGIITAASKAGWDQDVTELYPSPPTVSEAIPDQARRYLKQALQTLNSPDGSIVMSASAVDAMLKVKGYKEGSLYTRINKAVEDHLITAEMAKWAHQVRLDANDQRHADDEASVPTMQDAEKCVDFAQALAEFLFVLPSRVSRGITDASK